MKAHAEAATAAKARAVADASASADAAIASRLASCVELDTATMQAVLDHVQRVTGATGVYLAVKDGEAGAIAGPDDDEGARATMRYIGASSDHGHMLSKSVKQPAGVTFPVWVRPPKEEEEEEEEVEEGGAPKAKPPPPDLPPLHVPNVLRAAGMEFFGVPRLGAYLAVPFDYVCKTHASAISAAGLCVHAHLLCVCLRVVS